MGEADVHTFEAELAEVEALLGQLGGVDGGRGTMGQAGTVLGRGRGTGGGIGAKGLAGSSAPLTKDGVRRYESEGYTADRIDSRVTVHIGLTGDPPGLTGGPPCPPGLTGDPIGLTGGSSLAPAHADKDCRAEKEDGKAEFGALGGGHCMAVVSLPTVSLPSVLVPMAAAPTVLVPMAKTAPVGDAVEVPAGKAVDVPVKTVVEASVGKAVDLEVPAGKVVDVPVGKAFVGKVVDPEAPAGKAMEVPVGKALDLEAPVGKLVELPAGKVVEGEEGGASRAQLMARISSLEQEVRECGQSRVGGGGGREMSVWGADDCMGEGMEERC